MNAGLPVDPSVMATAPRRAMGIALRIALLTWLVAMGTLLLFVVVTVPQQKRTFLNHLASKANSVAVSLHDAAAGAAVNEDFASVVSAGETMVNGDPGLAFLVVMKNDGFSLVFEKSGWRAEPAMAAYWLPTERRATGAIATVPLFDRRVFHYAQPFDYSGIQWGWIHVGLSLKEYDRSVAILYRNTLLLALGCIALSLLSSVMYAGRLVRPVLRLRHVVRQIAGGDLSVRADGFGRDELGSLAESVNTMAEALLRRDRILESMRFAAQQFLRTSRWEESIRAVLAKIGEAADVSRAYIFENHPDEAGRLRCSLRHFWTAPGVKTGLRHADLQNISYEDMDFSHWRACLGRNEIIAGPLSALGAAERALLASQEVRSLIAIPVFVEGAWWGFLGFDDCLRERVWSDAEEDSLRAGADMLGACLARQRVQDALLEAKATLEQRVAARTRELQEQVRAKEGALAELADAQSSLLQVSRAAGMAEVATGVLHNVGNVLNSVNVSCTLIRDQLRQSRVGNVAKVAELITDPPGGLAQFLTQDPRGRQIPAYVVSLAAALQAEQQVMFKESEALRERIDHIMEIVAMQQSYGRVFGVKETIPPRQLMEDALKLNAEALQRHRITVQRQYDDDVRPVVVDKHKVLQILLNLIHNAKYACTDGNGEKMITLRVSPKGADRVVLQVTDTGMGIAAENLTRIFQHGFTTRKNGHGFGLHAGALAARELNGSLTVHSDGPGAGATFTLELPYCSGECE